MGDAMGAKPTPRNFNKMKIRAVTFARDHGYRSRDTADAFLHLASMHLRLDYLDEAFDLLGSALLVEEEVSGIYSEEYGITLSLMGQVCECLANVDLGYKDHGRHSLA